MRDRDRRKRKRHIIYIICTVVCQIHLVNDIYFLEDKYYYFFHIFDNDTSYHNLH